MFLCVSVATNAPLPVPLQLEQGKWAAGARQARRIGEAVKRSMGEIGLLS